MNSLLDILHRVTSLIPPNKRDYIQGLILLIIVVILWTSSNFVTQAMFQGGFEKPFLVTYLNTSSFALYLLPFIARRQIYGHATRNKNARAVGYQPLETNTGPEVEGQEQEVVDPSANLALRPLTVRETSNLALLFCFLWFIANWTINASLGYTSVASATILSSTSGLFTLAIGRLFLIETLTIIKFLAVVISFGGIVLVSLSDSSSSARPTPQPLPDVEKPTTQLVLGDFLALFSAIFYALYVTLLKVRIRSESRIDMQLFFGFVGLFNILTCWIIGVFLHLSGIEPFELPRTSTAIGAILINMFITFTSDYLYVIAMLKTTPLVVTIGLSLTIPLAVIGDLLLGKPTKAQVLVGAMLVLISFIVVGVDDNNMYSRKKGEPSIDSALDHEQLHDA